MDLKIKDVAELLNVSETTIRRWLGDGKIPSYCLNQQHRFNRLEIEDWVMEQKNGKFVQPTLQSEIQILSLPPTIEEELPLSVATTSRGSKQYSLYRALHRGHILYDVPGNTKEQLIQSVVKQISPHLNLDVDVVSDMLLARETLQSTGLNNGIAIPHTRDFLLDAHYDIVTVAFPKNPIPYDALDGKPVTTCFFLFASDGKRHLHLLAKIAHLSSCAKTLELLQSRPNKHTFLEYVKEWEASLQLT